MDLLLQGKTAWVTGAAGALGAAICRRFAEEGANIALSGRNAESLSDVADGLKAGTKSQVFVMDIIDRNQVDTTAKAVFDSFGAIDILVNSTTCPIFADFFDLSDDDWMAVLDAKALGYMRTSRAAIPFMLGNGGGNIVNVSGRGGHQPNSPSHLAGSCANAAVNTLTKGLANIYGPQGVRINAIAPGPVRSPRYDKIAAANEKISGATGDNSRSGAKAANPLGEMAEVDDIADAALYLASGMSRFVTGTIMQIDGGGTVSL